jgi:hypothetical protein
MATIKLDFASAPLGALQRARLPQQGAGLSQMPIGLATAPGEGLAEVGAVIGRLAAEAQRAQEAEIEQRERLALQRGAAEAAMALEFGEEQPDGTRRMVPAAEMGAFTERRMQALRTQQEAALGNLSGEARLRFQGFAAERMQDLQLRAARLQVARTAEEGQAATGDELRDFARQAASAPSDVQRREVLAEAERAIALRVQTGVLSPVQAQRMRVGFLGQVDQAAALRLIQSRPGEAAQRLADPEFLPNLDPVQRERLFGTAQSASAAAAARAEAAAARRERAVAMQANQVNGLLQAGVIPEARVAALEASARGTALEGQVRQMVADGRQMNAFALSSAAERQAALAEADARRRAPNATDDDQAHFARLAQTDHRIRTGFAQDGLGYAVQLGLAEPQPPINWGDPATLNSRVEAAAGVSQRQGYAISPFNREDLAAGVEAFTRGGTEQKLAVVQAVAAIADPQVRAAAIQHLERARGDAGRLPAGTLARVADMLRTGTVETQQAARRLIGDLTADVSDRARQLGETQEMRAALVSTQDSGVQGVRVRQAAIAGGGAHAALVSRDMDVIQRAAAARMASGESSASRAVEAAAATLNSGLAVVDDTSLGHVYFPATAGTPAQVTTGLRLLRDQAATVSTDPTLGADQAQGAIARREAARRAVWINEGGIFALVSRAQAGTPVVLRTATLDEVVRAADGQAAREAREPPQSPVARDAGPAVARPRISTTPSLQRGAAPTLR